MKHLTAEPELWPGETPQEFNAVCGEWQSTYDVTKPGTGALVEALVEADRCRRHNNRRLRQAERALSAAELSGDDKALRSARKSVEFAMRTQAASDRAFQRALRNAEQFAARRFKEEMTVRNVEARELKTALSLRLTAHKAQLPEAVLQSWLEAALADDAETQKRPPEVVQ